MTVMPVSQPETLDVNTPQSPEPDTPSRPIISKKEKKALKKQKIKATKDEGDDLDKALAELSIKYPELRQSAQSVVATKASNEFFPLLAVSLQHLDSEAEMRKFFGSKVVLSAHCVPRYLTTVMMGKNRFSPFVSSCKSTP